MKTINYYLIQTLSELSKYEDKRLPQKISYAIMKNIMTLQQEYALYDKQLKKLFADYEDKSVKDKDGNVTYSNSGIPVVQDEYADEFFNEINKLLNAEIEIDLYRIDKAAFDYEESDRYDNLTAKEIMKLTEILCE